MLEREREREREREIWKLVAQDMNQNRLYEMELNRPLLRSK